MALNHDVDGKQCFELVMARELLIFLDLLVGIIAQIKESFRMGIEENSAEPKGKTVVPDEFNLNLIKN